MVRIKILRSAYQRIPQSSLVTYAENIFKRTNGIAGYESHQKRIEALGIALDVYHAALIAAQNKGVSEMNAKTDSRVALKLALDLLVHDLEHDPMMTQQRIIDAGFSLQPARAPIFKGQLLPPEIKASSTGQRGVVKVSLKNPFPKAVLVHALEYSIDDAINWENGTYQNVSNFIIEGLPATLKLLIRARAIGKNGKKSEWSAPVVTGVL